MRSALRYQPDQEQLSLASGLEAPVAALLKVSRLHRGGGGEDDVVWRQLSDLGVFAAGLDESQGGSGLGAAETTLIGIALGRALAAPSVFATMCALGAASALSGVHGEPRIAAAFAAADGAWIDQPGAEFVLARTAEGAAIHATPPSPQVLDDSTWGARIMRGDFSRPLAQIDDGGILRLRLMDAAALAGIAEATLAMAVDYAKTREQFGRPIGTFQAVKHHCANMAIAARGARDLATFAAVAIDTDRPEARHRAECAFLVAARAAIDNAGMNIQIHGGIGFSAEADPHLFLKRAQLLTSLGGGVEAAALRVADASLHMASSCA
jgi:alkylation response protein AidB-like acyl-CoA dehydrogenase